MVLDLLARHTFSDLVARGKEGAVGERADQDGGYGDASQEHVEDDDLKSHGFQGVCASDDHADHCAWKEDDPRGLCGVYEGDEGALEGRLEDGGYGLWRLVAPRARAASSLGRCSLTSSRMRVSVRLAAFMEFPITMPPSGIR